VGSGPEVIGGCEAHDLESAAVGDTFRIFVGRCGRGAETDTPLPVLYLTDANGAFGMAVDIVRHLQLGRHLPPMLVVGIGYPVDHLGATIDRRSRDLSDGAPAFAAFLRDQLFPWVADHVGETGTRTYFGHSLGGLFGALVLFDRPDTFANYALASPSTWWSEYGILGIEERFHADHDDLDATVLVTVGAEETTAGRRREAAELPASARPALIAPPRDMAADARTFADRLAGRGYPSLRLGFAAIDGECHVSVPPVALSRSLRAIFGAPGHARLVPRLG
jgi:uncharacterized protein